jgi:hypothetical protein
LSRTFVFRVDQRMGGWVVPLPVDFVKTFCFPRRVVKKLRKRSCRGEWVWYGVNVDYEYQQIGTPQ